MTVTSTSQQHARQGITTSNGFVDVMIIDVENEPQWVLPSKLIIGVDTYDSSMHFIPWQNQSIPVLSLLVAPATSGVVLIINADEPDRQFALMVREQPKSQRIRISSLRDYTDPSSKNLPFLFQSVLLDGVIMQVPNIDMIEKRAFGLDDAATAVDR